MVANSKPTMSVVFKERESVSDAKFGCFIQPGELRNARSKFRSFRHREIDSAKSERCE